MTSADFGDCWAADSCAFDRGCQFYAELCSFFEPVQEPLAVVMRDE